LTVSLFAKEIPETWNIGEGLKQQTYLKNLLQQWRCCKADVNFSRRHVATYKYR